MDMEETWMNDSTIELQEDSIDESTDLTPLPNPRVAELRGEGRGRGRGNRNTNNNGNWTIDKEPNPPESNPELMENDLNILPNGPNTSRMISLKNNHRRSLNPTHENLSLADFIRTQQQTDGNNFSLEQYAKDKKIGYDKPKYGDKKQQRNGRNDENMDIDNNNVNNNGRNNNRNNNWRRGGTSPTPSNNSSNGRRFGNNNNDNNDYNNNNTSNVKKYTPDSCLHLLAKTGYAFEYEVSEMIDEEHPEFSKRRWRVVYYVLKDGERKTKGIGEGRRKSLAKECAALDLVEKIRETDAPAELPECEIQKGARISPHIETLLDNYCKENDLGDPQYIPTLSVSNGREMHQMGITVGGQAFKARSCDIKFAKLLACKQAYETLAEREFRLEPIVRGIECAVEEEYKFLESAELHVLHSSGPMPDRPVGYDSCTSSVPGSPILWNNQDSTGGESGRGTPSSVCSAKRIKIATSSEEPMPPMLKQLRQQAQNEANRMNVPIDITDGTVSVDELPVDENINFRLPNGVELETPSGFTTYSPLAGNRKRSMSNRESAFIEVGEQDMNGSSSVLQVPKPILKGIKRIALNTDSQVPIHKFIEDNWDSVKKKVLEEMKIWEEISDDGDDDDEEEGGSAGIDRKKKNTLIVSAIGFSNTLASAEKAACAEYEQCVNRLAGIFGTNK